MLPTNPLAYVPKHVLFSLNSATESEVIECVQDAPAQKTENETAKREHELQSSLMQQRIFQVFNMSIFPSNRYWDALLNLGRGQREQAEQSMREVRQNARSNLYPWQVQKPKCIDDFFDKLFVIHMQTRPQNLNQMGLLESIGVNFHNQFLNDSSVFAKRERIQHARDNLSILQSYDYFTLNSKQQVSYKVFEWTLRGIVEGESFFFHPFILTNTSGVLSDLTETLTHNHIIKTCEDFENYQARLNAIPLLLIQVKDFMNQQWANRVRLPVFTLNKLIAALEKFVNLPWQINPFYSHCKELIQNLPVSFEDELQYIEIILINKVVPAYQDLLRFLKHQREFSKTNHGVSELPDGNEYYAYCLRQSTTTNLSAEDIHQIGLKEAKKIEHEIRQLLDSVDLNDDSKTIDILMKQFGDIPLYGVDTLRIRMGNKILLPLRNDMPLLQQYLEFKAYDEGRILFDERLAYETGVLKTVKMKLSFLRHDLLQAIRLVIDTAIHHKGCSRENAINYMQKMTGYERKFVIAEVESCFVSPGQACVTKIGHLKMLELQQKAMDALGNDFLLKEFHEFIFNVGSVPLGILEEQVEKYIDSIKSDYFI
jgi:uncharacterized protein (DUF885 family)